MKPTLQVITLGCSKNTVDTEHLLGALCGKYEILPEGISDVRADVLLLNTCGFIGDAKEESIQAILEAVSRKEAGLVGRLGVFGCLSQRYPTELPGLIPEVDWWWGARDPGAVVRELGGDEKDLAGRFMTGGGASYAFLKISEGCDRRCSYCAIPLIRGAHKSVPLEDLVRETELLVSKGVREIVVIAQDTTFYGLDIYGRRALADALRAISSVEGVEWIRIHYSYPADFPEDVLEEMASNPKICPYLDIPLQHISDPVLKAMRRHVTSSQTRALVRSLREKVPGVVLRTTMMVGHPGEGEEQFEELLDFCREARFERLGAFAYSEEEGTYGAKHLPDAVPPDVKQERLSRLMALQSGISLDFNMSRVGTTERVLVDSTDGDVYVCRSRFESPDVDGEILLKTDKLLKAGDFADVRIIGADEYDLIAESV